MKLKNKKTGEICNWCIDKDVIYNSLAELNAEWEDAPEEPKGVKSIYFIGATVYIEMSNQKEAIEVEEKLKAWKRLKDKGFKFNGGDDACISYILDPVKWEDELEKDFDLLFGGEE